MGTRINVYSYDDEDGRRLEGWFDVDRAEVFAQGKEWDGNNMIGVITRSQWIDERLYRTKGGRWVRNHDAHRYCNGASTFEFIDDEQAREWLIQSEANDEAIARWFGELEEERGPGRPGVGEGGEPGARVEIRLAPDVLAQVDQRAAAEGVKRAEMVRRLVGAGLAS